MSIRIEIPGRIVAKQSVRFTRTGHAYQPGDIVNYHARCAVFSRQAMEGRAPLTCACRVCIQVVLQTPRTWSKKQKAQHNWCVKTPDLDNVCKAICDGLKYIVYADDKQIVELTCSKRYGAADRVIVTVEPLEADARAWCQEQAA